MQFNFGEIMAALKVLYNKVHEVIATDLPQLKPIYPGGGGGGGTLGISGWGCATGTLEPLTYTRASLAEFCYPILE